ncbi:DUF4097 domain-containing protein, partial [Salmonella enterica]|nr:DUF4097 domain-containing protein [Salmonella enterica]
MLSKKIENMTTVDMGGTAIFDDSSATDKGWSHDYTLEDLPNRGWIFNNTIVNAGGDVDVKGAGFTNSTVNVSSGNLSIDNNSAALLTGTTITVGDGAVNVHAGAGNIDLSKGNISAKGDITLQTDNGSISISGTNATQIASITSDSGNISITSNTETGNALTFDYVDLNTQEGNISISGVSSNSNGVVIRNTNIHGNASIYGETSADQGNEFYGHGLGGVVIGGVNISSGNVYIHGVSNGRGMGVNFWEGTNQINELSVLNIYGETKSGNDAWGYSSGVVFTGASHSINNGVLNITGVASSSSGKASGINMGLYNQFSPGVSPYVLFKFSGSKSVAISGYAVLGNGVGIDYGLTALNNVVTVNGSSLKGYGVVLTSKISSDSNANLKITGTTDSGDAGVLVNHGFISSADDHALSISGHSNGSGAGVMMSSGYDNSIIRVDVNATSVNGSGLVVNNKSQITDSNVTAASENQTGIVISGTLNGGTVTGESALGAGVVLGDDAKITSTSISGMSEFGTGVSIAGKTSLDEQSAGLLSATSDNGTGLGLSNNTVLVVVQNGMTTPVEVPVVLTGASLMGSGVATSGNVSISGAILKGTAKTDSGTGVTLGGNLTIADAISGVTADATGNGTALVMNDASVNASGYTDAGQQFVINASVSGNGTAIKTQGSNRTGDVVLNGAASGGGTAVELGGQVSGANITGTSD